MGLIDFLSERGKRTRELLTGDAGRPSPVDLTDPDYQQLFADFIYGGMYSREVVPQRVRELIAVGCLTALYRPDELRSHIRMALRLTAPEEVREAILQAGVYGGFPSTMAGLRILGEVLAGSGARP
ncbi:MAG TPA: carboxymuconolactone decarboxylase family protein [Dehalococcoidia bacterium]|nr:carboxymuconolactone decarboxylase family protein [Dehalococcoidia bacterium]